MTRKRHPWASLKARERWGHKGFHCTRLSCMERATTLCVLARPHVGPPIVVWVCPQHAKELEPAR